MNDFGTVVGNCFGAGSGFIDKNGLISYVNYTALGNGDVFYTQLSGINDVGEVVGSFSAVPEPASLVSLLVGISALALAITLQKCRD
jgi:hypothetical protein